MATKNSWKKRKDGDRIIYTLPGVIGNAAYFDNNQEVELHSHFNGSGSSAFGGAKSWPAVSAVITFQSHETKKAAKFAKALCEFTSKFFENYKG